MSISIKNVDIYFNTKRKLHTQLLFFATCYNTSLHALLFTDSLLRSFFTNSSFLFFSPLISFTLLFLRECADHSNVKDNDSSICNRANGNFPYKKNIGDTQGPSMINVISCNDDIT